MWPTRLGGNRSRTLTTTPKCGTPSRRCFNSRVNYKQSDPEKQSHCSPPYPEPASMSRLFEALQRSEPETFGFDFALPEPPDSELVKAAEAETLKPTEAEAPSPAETQIPEFGQFPSLPVSLSPGSRIVSWSGREESSLAAEKF